MKRLFLGVLCLALFAVQARAHFVWILPADAKGKALVVFSDGMGPDESVPINKIAQTTVYARGKQGATLQMKQQGNAYVVELPAGTCTVGGECVYGIVQREGAEPFLLVYHPRAVVGDVAAQVREQAANPWNRLKLQITLRPGEAGSLGGIVHWNGKPLAGAEVVGMLPGLDEQVTVKTNEQGAFNLPPPKKVGTIAIRAAHFVTQAGKENGKDYKATRHYATLTVPSQPFQVDATPATETTSLKADPDATRLLQEARRARAEWENFPGFSANLLVNMNGKTYRGSVIVRRTGKVRLEGFNDEAVNQWLQRQLQSLVQHRLSGAADRETPCVFSDENENHPLGRKIRLLEDEMHSSYRIRDRQVIEVNRDSGKTRFTITVLNNQETPEKKYLPTSYIVSTWNKETGALISTVAHYDIWRRVGGFDLPESIMTVTARGGDSTANGSTDSAQSDAAALDARSIQFSNHQLLERN